MESLGSENGNFSRHLAEKPRKTPDFKSRHCVNPWKTAVRSAFSSANDDNAVTTGTRWINREKKNQETRENQTATKLEMKKKIRLQKQQHQNTPTTRVFVASLLTY